MLDKIIYQFYLKIKGTRRFIWNNISSFTKRFRSRCLLRLGCCCLHNVSNFFYFNRFYVINIFIIQIQFLIEKKIKLQ